MTDRKPTVVVTPDETLPEVVARLREAARGGEVVALVVPIDSALLLTAREFRTLKEAIDEERLAVVVRTADPLRLQLAERLGIRAQALPRPRVAAATVTAPPPPAPALNPIASGEQRRLAGRNGPRRIGAATLIPASPGHAKAMLTKRLPTLRSS